MFHTSRAIFKSYQVESYLKNYQYYLDRQCKLQTCSVTCLKTEICQICESDRSVDIKVLKCNDIQKKVRITQEEEYHAACHQLKSFHRQVCIDKGETWRVTSPRSRRLISSSCSSLFWQF